MDQGIIEWLWAIWQSLVCSLTFYTLPGLDYEIGLPIPLGRKCGFVICHVHWEMRSNTCHFWVECVRSSTPFIMLPLTLCLTGRSSLGTSILLAWVPGWTHVRWSYQTTQDGKEHEKGKETHICYFKTLKFKVLYFTMLFISYPDSYWQNT